MGDNIRISPKHGLNPTIPTCAWCGEPKNEIALLGKYTKEDLEAPKNIILDYNPCDKCSEQWKQGVPLIEVSSEKLHPNQMPIQKNLYPTGSLLVITLEAAKNIFNTNVEIGAPLLIEDALFKDLFKDALDNLNSLDKKD